MVTPSWSKGEKEIDKTQVNDSVMEQNRGVARGGKLISTAAKETTLELN